MEDICCHCGLLAALFPSATIEDNFLEVFYCEVLASFATNVVKTPSINPRV